VREILSEQLWIGNAHDVSDVRRVLSLGITAIVDLAIDELPRVYPRDIIYCRLPLIDGGGNVPVVLETAIQTAVAFVTNEITTLIACSGGMSRSVAIAAAAMAVLRGQEIDQVLQQVALGGPHDIAADLWADVKKTATRIQKLT
jgi:protein-tyrosine phosphatase